MTTLKKRDCENCANHKPDGCSSWECEFRPAGADLISRRDAIDAVNRVNNSHMKLKGAPMLGWCTLLDEIEALPSANPNANCDYVERR